MKVICGFLMTAILGLGGCVHDAMHGSVTSKISDQEGQVRLGSNEVKSGDRVALYDNECSPSTLDSLSSAYEPPCRRVKVGEGQITQVLDERHSVVKADPGTTLKEGTIAVIIR
jgi:hypothetical protein